MLNRDDFDKLKEKNKLVIEERRKQIKEYWRTREPFKDVNDIPNLPIVDEKEWKEFYIPRLIELGAIPKDKLVDGVVYDGDHRNAQRARWIQNENRFQYIRHKFHFIYYDYCNHFEDDNRYALFVPIKVSDDQTFEIK
jgi:hypothetical protein